LQVHRRLLLWLCVCHELLHLSLIGLELDRRRCRVVPPVEVEVGTGGMELLACCVCCSPTWIRS
jgi:hypothetical protein